MHYYSANKSPFRYSNDPQIAAYTHMNAAKFERALLENLNSAVLAFNQDQHLLYANPAAEELFAMSERHMQGMSMQELLPCKQRGQTAGQGTQSLRNGEAITERGIIMPILGQSTSVTVDCTLMPFELESERMLLVEIQQIDRRLRMSREERLMTENEASHQLLRGLAHEIKNPLGGIRGAAQLLEQELSSANLHEYTQTIIRETDRLRLLVDRMLIPRTLPRLRWLSIHQVLEHVCQLVSAEAGEAIQLVRDFDPSIPDLHIDQDQLIQAFLNILRNAVTALNGQGAIQLRTRVMRQFTIGNKLYRLVVRIEIIDSGPGIPEKIREKIFFPMVSGNPNGTGLGLTIAQSLIASHEGLIEYHSKPGETCFSIYLPLESVHV